MINDDDILILVEILKCNLCRLTKNHGFWRASLWLTTLICFIFNIIFF